MQAKLFVGNLPYQASEDDLKSLFGDFGSVLEINLVRDKYSGQSKGFAFIQLGSGDEAEKALVLDGQDFMGRKISVSEARPPKKDFRSDSRRPGGRDNRNHRSY